MHRSLLHSFGTLPTNSFAFRCGGASRTCSAQGLWQASTQGFPLRKDTHGCFCGRYTMPGLCWAGL